MNNYVAALLLEREGYLRRGRQDRVAMIDEALRDIGFEHDYLTTPVETASVQPNVETTTRKKPTPRKKG